MKNDTITTPRLESILTILTTGSHSRLMLEDKLDLTRITLIRALDKLIKLGQVESIGKGRATRYQLTDFNPLLSPATTRTLNQEVTFNSSVFDHLHHLLTPQEQDNLTLPSLSQASTTLGPIITAKERTRFTIDFAWKSSAIEGNTYTLPQAVTLLTTHTPAPEKTSLESQMILNHEQAVNYIWDHPPKTGSITLQYILHIHSLLTKDLNIKPGIRHHSVGITGSIYLPLSNPQDISLAIEQAIQIINQTTHPVEQTLIAVSMLSYIQPFTDGNKRTARLVGNAILLSHDLIPISYRTVDENTYRDHLLLFYEQNSLTAFKSLLLEQLSFAHSHYFRTNTT